MGDLKKNISFSNNNLTSIEIIKLISFAKEANIDNKRIYSLIRRKTKQGVYNLINDQFYNSRIEKSTSYNGGVLYKNNCSHFGCSNCITLCISDTINRLINKDRDYMQVADMYKRYYEFLLDTFDESTDN